MIKIKLYKPYGGFYENSYMFDYHIVNKYLSSNSIPKDVYFSIGCDVNPASIYLLKYPEIEKNEMPINTGLSQHAPQGGD